MSSLDMPRTRRSPGLYRVSRLLRWISAAVLVLLLIFVGTVGYSAARFAEASPETGGYAASFAANDTISLSGSLSISNPGYYSVSGFSLGLRIENGSGVLLGGLATPPITLAAGSTSTVPVGLSVPIEATGAAVSLLISDQFLSVGVWGNATYAVLFPVSVHFVQQRSWGAPFADLSVTAGTPFAANGSLVVPITIAFANHSTLYEDGTLELELRSSSGSTCGATAFPMNVPPGMSYDQTENVALASGCSVTGGSAQATYVSGGTSVPLPPQALP